MSEHADQFEDEPGDDDEPEDLEQPEDDEPWAKTSSGNADDV